MFSCCSRDQRVLFTICVSLQWREWPKKITAALIFTQKTTLQVLPICVKRNGKMKKAHNEWLGFAWERAPTATTGGDSSQYPLSLQQVYYVGDAKRRVASARQASTLRHKPRVTNSTKHCGGVNIDFTHSPPSYEHSALLFPAREQGRATVKSDLSVALTSKRDESLLVPPHSYFTRTEGRDTTKMLILRIILMGIPLLVKKRLTEVLKPKSNMYSALTHCMRTRWELWPQHRSKQQKPRGS